MKRCAAIFCAALLIISMSGCQKAEKSLTIWTMTTPENLGELTYGICCSQDLSAVTQMFEAKYPDEHFH